MTGVQLQTCAVTSVWYDFIDFQTWQGKEILVRTNNCKLPISFYSKVYLSSKASSWHDEVCQWLRVNDVIEVCFVFAFLTPTRAYTHYPNFKVHHKTHCYFQEKCHTQQWTITCPRLNLIDVQTTHRAQCVLMGRGMWNWRGLACMQPELSCPRKTKNEERKRARKAVISQYKWIGVECPNNLKRGEKRDSLTGGGPSGAVRRVAARHNTGEVAVLRLSPVGHLNTLHLG